MVKRRKDSPPARPRPVAEVVEKILDRCGLRKQRDLFRLYASWEEIVGGRLASHSQVLRLRGGVLEVRVDQAVWMQHLQLQKRYILAAVNRYLGEDLIEDIFWRFGVLEDVAANEHPAAEEEPRPVFGAELEPETEELLQALPDPRLRETFRRLIGEAKGRA